MSFRCDKCNTTTARGVPINKAVVKTRHKVYEKTHKDKNGFVHVTRSEGREIVKELKLCPICFTLVTGEQPNERQDVRRFDERSFTERKNVKQWKGRRNNGGTKTQRSSGRR